MKRRTFLSLFLFVFSALTAGPVSASSHLEEFLAALKENNEKNASQLKENLEKIVKQPSAYSIKDHLASEKSKEAALDFLLEEFESPDVSGFSGEEINERFFSLNMKIASEIKEVETLKELSQIATLGSKEAQRDLEKRLNALQKRQNIRGDLPQSESFFPDWPLVETAKTVFLQTTKNTKEFSVKELANIQAAQEALSWVGSESCDNNDYFIGTACSCRDFSISGIRSCCINDGLLIDLNLAPCNAEEKKLANKQYRSNYCIFMGEKGSNVSMELPNKTLSWEYSRSKVYLCFKSPIGKALHQIQILRFPNWLAPVKNIKHEGPEKYRYKKHFTLKELKELVEFTESHQEIVNDWSWYKR